MTFVLTPVNPVTGPSISLQRPVLLVGRHRECDVRIHLPKISRRHCCLAIAYDRILIRDLGSRNGVRVNGKVVDEVQLAEGDEVAIGPLIYRLVPESAPAPATPQPAASPSRDASQGGAQPGQAPVPKSPRDQFEEMDLVPLDDLD